MGGWLAARRLMAGCWLATHAHTHTYTHTHTHTHTHTRTHILTTASAALVAGSCTTSQLESALASDISFWCQEPRNLGGITKLPEAVVIFKCGAGTKMEHDEDFRLYQIQLEDNQKKSPRAERRNCCGAYTSVLIAKAVRAAHSATRNGEDVKQCRTPQRRAQMDPSTHCAFVSELREHTNAQAVIQFVEAIALLILLL